MSEQQLILEIGMGADVHGRDMTKAALRAVSDAIRHSSLSVFATWKVPHKMRIEVTIACPDPEAVDRAAVAAALPYGTVEVICEAGGLTDEGMGGSADTTLVIAGVRAFLETGNSPFTLQGD
ncbi:Lin0512 family protein [Jannaschia sp. M317]|uniref:Lin0512 family protein n=1 Tax=Jannaschia sp. M317 TaxID=2867011 RepID=UPI0021A558CD|nr:Lin0512 family protein [Jannaschia sp. M317]UWQ18416.1 Lin0512 family protein [Jannaschia sp. M317]